MRTNLFIKVIVEHDPKELLRSSVPSFAANWKRTTSYASGTLQHRTS